MASFGIGSGILVVAAAAWTVHYFWERAHEPDGRATWRSLTGWMLKGFAWPALAWLLLNSTWVSGLPPMIRPPPGIPAGTGVWFRELPNLLSPGIAAIATFWGAVTLGWLVAQVVRPVERRDELPGLILFWSILPLPVSLLLLWIGGWSCAGAAAMCVLGPVLYGVLPLRPGRKLPPLYARAIAHTKFGRYPAAEQAVLHELDKVPEDFDGWMMLADLYAHHFNDLTLADQTIRDLCEQPNIDGVQASLALHRLADWHLDLAQDPVAARGALEVVLQKFPGTHAARMAQQRLDRMPATTEALREQRQVRPLRLPALGDPLDDERTARSEVSPVEAQARARHCVQKLEANPNDEAAREELARLLAESLGQADRAIEQLELLLALPGPPSPRAPEWLALIATWQRRFRGDPAAVRQTLERLVREHPQTPQAFAAQRRLNLMDMDDRVRAARRGPARQTSGEAE